jgi:hypothetical protein
MAQDNKPAAPAKQAKVPTVIAVVGGPSKDLSMIHRIDELAGVTASAEVRDLTENDISEIDQLKTPIRIFVDRSLAEEYANQINSSILTRRAQIMKKDAKTERDRAAFYAKNPELKSVHQQRSAEAARDAKKSVLSAQTKQLKALEEKQAQAQLNEELGKGI